MTAHTVPEHMHMLQKTNPQAGWERLFSQPFEEVDSSISRWAVSLLQSVLKVQIPALGEGRRQCAAETTEANLFVPKSYIS